jgi:hypothetical protein
MTRVSKRILESCARDIVAFNKRRFGESTAEPNYNCYYRVCVIAGKGAPIKEILDLRPGQSALFQIANTPTAVDHYVPTILSEVWKMREQGKTLTYARKVVDEQSYITVRRAA